MRPSVVAFTVIWLAACVQAKVITAPDDAAVADAPNDARVDAAVADAGPLPEVTGGGECDQQDDCDSCATCSQAAFRQCNALTLACEDDAECVALHSCINGCGTQECTNTCAAAHTGAIDLLNSLLQCMVCTACPADCRELRFTWCESPPL